MAKSTQTATIRQTSVTLVVAEDHIWQCKCKTNNWHFRDEKCLTCRQTFKGQRRKALDTLGMTAKKREKKKKNGQDKSKFKKCNACGGLFDKDYCPDCGIELVVVTIIEIAVISTRSFEDNSYA